MSFYRQPLNEFLSRTIFFLFIATVVLCIYQGYEIQVILKPQIGDNNGPIIERLHSFDYSEVETAVHQQKKLFFAFFYWEQLTMATNNLLHLSALAAQGRRQVVVPFVKDSQFRGVPQSKRKQPYYKLGLYYDVTALNESLRLHGYGTLIDWEGFQDVCKGKLDVLVYFHYTNLTNITSNNLSTSYVPCKLNQKHVFLGIKIGRKICVNANVFHSVQRFEDEIVEKLPCVGIMQWRGTSKTKPFRTHFNIESLVDKVLSYVDMGAFFSSKLLRIAQDFIAQRLISNFISVHVRTEQILVTGGNISTVKRCLFKLRKRLQSIIQLATVPNPPIFLAADFTKFGSSSETVKPARKHAKSFMKILLPLRPIVFHPSEYKIVDRGAAAIVEMNILSSGSRLFVLGGGSFQLWITTQFLSKNYNQRSKVERIVC